LNIPLASSWAISLRINRVVAILGKVSGNRGLVISAISSLDSFVTACKM
jgi:hypothetical protein